MTISVRDSQTVADLIPVLDELMEVYFASLRACGASTVQARTFYEVIVSSGWARALITTYLEKWEREGKLVNIDADGIYPEWEVVRD